MRFRLIFWLLSLTLMSSNISNIRAKAPATAKIVFGSYRDGNGEIYIMNPDGSEQVNLTRDPAEDLFPVWSPNGEEILFASNRNGIRDLYLMDADGSDIRKVFKQTAHRDSPTWSPDGKQIAYIRGINAIYIATLGKQAEEYLVEGFDPRAIWAVENAVITTNGTPLLNRCGHSFIKTRMRETNALFAGEASGHYYFRDNFCTDNGMIPFLLVLEHLSRNRVSLAESVDQLRSEYPVSGEINFSFETCEHIQDAMEVIRQTTHHWGNYPCIETPIDGLSVRFFTNHSAFAPEHGSWRFNLRESNTEPLLRLNVETIGNEDLLIEKTMGISSKLESIGGKRETKFRWESE